MLEKYVTGLNDMIETTLRPVDGKECPEPLRRHLETFNRYVQCVIQLKAVQ